MSNATKVTAPADGQDFKPDPLVSAYDLSRITCQRYGVRDFDTDLVDHFRSGLVIGTPYLFLMAKASEFPDGRRAWVITHAHGDLKQLATVMPFYLPWIAFRRRLERKLTFYPTDRFIEHARNITT